MIIDIVKSEAKKAAPYLSEGYVVAIPTETVMGLAVVFDNYDSYLKLNQIKNRPENKPYSLMVGNTNQIEKYAYVDERVKILIDSFLPGPLTILLKAKDSVPSYVTHNSGIVGIRVPNNPFINRLFKEIDKPLLVPSANRSGELPLTKYLDVINEFKNELGYIVKIDAGGELPSTIVDLTSDEIKIIREGLIKKEDILEVLNK